MRRSVVPVLLLILIFLAFGPVGCGGGSTVGPVHTVTVSPSPLSMNLGQMQQLTASVTDVNNNAVSTQTISYISGNSNIASVSPSGLVCAGTWDSTYVHCNPGKVGGHNHSRHSFPFRRFQQLCPGVRALQGG